MEFEITTIRDDNISRRRMIIDKTFRTFPVIQIANLDETYEGYDAKILRRSRDNAFALIGDKSHSEYFNRRFIQNSTFISDTLEVELQRDIARDLGFVQHINLSVAQIHGRLDPAVIQQQATDDEGDALEALLKMYENNNLSTQTPNYALMEQLIRQTPVYLGEKKPKYHITPLSTFGFVLNYRTTFGSGSEMFTYALGFKQKRGKRNVSTVQPRVP